MKQHIKFFHSRYILIFVNIILFSSLCYSKSLDLQVQRNGVTELKINSHQIGDLQVSIFNDFFIRYMQTLNIQDTSKQLAGGSIGYSKSIGDNIFSFQLGLDGLLLEAVYNEWLVFQYEGFMFNRLYLYPQLIFIWDSNEIKILPVGGTSFKVSNSTSLAFEYSYRIFYDIKSPVINGGLIFTYGKFSTSTFIQASIPSERLGDVSLELSFSIYY